MNQKPPCPVCGSESVFHGPELHTFARRRRIVENRHKSEVLIHKMLGLFPDLAHIHAPACKLKDHHPS